MSLAGQNDIRVLVVDDEPVVRETVFCVLKDYGFNVEMARNGKEALEKVLARTPDVIILDVEMPEMDGRETYGKLRQDASTRDIPIIFFSGQNEALAGLTETADSKVAFVRKPGDIESLLRHINNYKHR